MLNSIMKASAKNSPPRVMRFWELAVQEINAGKLPTLGFLVQPYRETKELGEDSKNPIEGLPKLSSPAGKVGWG